MELLSPPPLFRWDGTSGGESLQRYVQAPIESQQLPRNQEFDDTQESEEFQLSHIPPLFAIINPFTASPGLFIALFLNIQLSPPANTCFQVNVLLAGNCTSNRTYQHNSSLRSLRISTAFLRCSNMLADFLSPAPLLAAFRIPSVSCWERSINCVNVRQFLSRFKHARAPSF